MIKNWSFLIALINLNTMNSNKILQVCTVFFANKNLDEEVLGLFEGKSKRRVTLLYFYSLPSFWLSSAKRQIALRVQFFIKVVVQRKCISQAINSCKKTFKKFSLQNQVQTDQKKWRKLPLFHESIRWIIHLFISVRENSNSLQRKMEGTYVSVRRLFHE